MMILKTPSCHFPKRKKIIDDFELNLLFNLSIQDSNSAVHPDFWFGGGGSEKVPDRRQRRARPGDHKYKIRIMVKIQEHIQNTITNKTP